MDSSRYFAMRIENPENKHQHVFIGIGFNDRDVGSHFKHTLAEHGRYLARLKKANEEMAAHALKGQDSPSSDTCVPTKDLSLKGNIRIALPHTAAAAAAKSASGPLLGLSSGGACLVPPPSVTRARGTLARASARRAGPGSKSSASVDSSPSSAVTAQEEPRWLDEDFGEFVG
jgi:hypothetical protein